MPRVDQVDGAKLYIYFGDHNPPHFHAIQGDDAALITIRDFVVLEGTVPSLRAVLAWARENQTRLVSEWNRCNPDKPF